MSFVGWRVASDKGLASDASGEVVHDCEKPATGNREDNKALPADEDLATEGGVDDACLAEAVELADFVPLEVPVPLRSIATAGAVGAVPAAETVEEAVEGTEMPWWERQESRRLLWRGREAARMVMKAKRKKIALDANMMD